MFWQTVFFPTLLMGCCFILFFCKIQTGTVVLTHISTIFHNWLIFFIILYYSRKNFFLHSFQKTWNNTIVNRVYEWRVENNEWTRRRLRSLSTQWKFCFVAAVINCVCVQRMFVCFVLTTTISSVTNFNR